MMTTDPDKLWRRLPRKLGVVVPPFRRRRAGPRAPPRPAAELPGDRSPHTRPPRIPSDSLCRCFRCPQRALTWGHASAPRVLRRVRGGCDRRPVAVSEHVPFGCGRGATARISIRRRSRRRQSGRSGCPGVASRWRAQRRPGIAGKQGRSGAAAGASLRCAWLSVSAGRPLTPCAGGRARQHHRLEQVALQSPRAPHAARPKDEEISPRPFANATPATLTNLPRTLGPCAPQDTSTGYQALSGLTCQKKRSFQHSLLTRSLPCEAVRTSRA